LGLVAAGAANGMYTLDLKQKLLLVLALILVPALGLAALDDNSSDNEDSGSDASGIIAKYLQATQHHDELRNASMQVDIDASIVKLKEHGKLRALRKISKVGEVTYRVLFFQGDNTVKNDVIARYLQAEQQGRGDQKLAISPANYKFKFRGKKSANNGSVYVFQLSPRKKKVGLFKGEMWIDAGTYLPLVEKGKLVKNPSIWFKKVEFEREFAIRNGVAVPSKMNSTIDVRLIGKVDLQINYSNFVQNADVEDDGHARAQGLASIAAN
jgi:hypothetical protein